MESKKILLPKDENGLFLLPEAAPVERVELFPGHTIVLTTEDREELDRLHADYEQIVSTTAIPAGELVQPADLEGAVIDLVEAEPTFLQGLFKK